MVPGSLDFLGLKFFLGPEKMLDNMVHPIRGNYKKYENPNLISEYSK